MDVLDGRTPLNDASISTAMKMSWASRRITTRIEDEAYCLLGIFDVNMPMLYGEGNKAFIRLQEEIIRRSNDQTIFGWSGPEAQLLAPTPSRFKHSGSMIPMPSTDSRATLSYELNNRGLRICLTVVSRSEHRGSSKEDYYYLILDCYRKQRVGELIALELVIEPLIGSKIVLANHEIRYFTSKDRLFSMESLDSPLRNPRQYFPRCTKLEMVILREAKTSRADALLPVRLVFEDSGVDWKFRDCYPPGSWNLESFSTEIRAPFSGLGHRSVLELHRDSGSGVYLFLGIGSWSRDVTQALEPRTFQLVQNFLDLMKSWIPIPGLLERWLLSYYVASRLRPEPIHVHLAQTDVLKTDRNATVHNFLSNTEQRFYNSRSKDYIKIGDSKLYVRVETASFASSRYALQIVVSMVPTTTWTDVWQWMLLSGLYMLAFVVLALFVALSGLVYGIFILFAVTAWGCGKWLDHRERYRFR